MLTVILLVVLGGGTGLLAVWMVDSGSVRRVTERSGSLRARSRSVTAPDDLAAQRPPTADLEAVDSGGPRPAPTYAPLPAPSTSGPTRRRRRGAVPAQFTAVEGSWRDVAVTPLWRKLVSLVLLVVVLFTAGVALAAIAAATLGLVADLVDRAIG